MRAVPSASLPDVSRTAARSVIAAGTSTIVIVSGFDAVSLAASVASTTNPLVPAAPGVPVSAPVPASSASPAGRLPSAIDHVIGAVPPLAATASEYATLTVPVASDDVVTVSARAADGASAAIPAASAQNAARRSAPETPSSH